MKNKIKKLEEQREKELDAIWEEHYKMLGKIVDKYFYKINKLDDKIIKLKNKKADEIEIILKQIVKKEKDIENEYDVLIANLKGEEK